MGTDQMRATYMLNCLECKGFVDVPRPAPSNWSAKGLQSRQGYIGAQRKDDQFSAPQRQLTSSPHAT